MARTEGKLLLVDFPSPGRWDGPPEKAPWRDEAVREWIAEHAVAVQIDKYKDPELANRLGVDDAPMLLILRDGVELDRHSDFEAAADFLEWAEGVLQGRTRQQRHHEEIRELAKGRSPALTRYAYELKRERSFDAATEALAKAWDIARREHELILEMVGDQMRDLADEHPPARAAFERLLAETELRTFASDPPYSANFMQWIKLCEALGKEQRVLSWFEQTRDEDGQLYGRLLSDPAVENEAKLRMQVLEFLIDQRHFDEAARLYDDPARYASLLSFGGTMGRGVAAVISIGADEESYIGGLPENVAKGCRREIARIHAVTLAAGRPEDADQVAQVLLRDDDEGLGRIALVKASLDLKTSPPTEASRWLDEAKALGADVDELRGRLAKATAGQAKATPPAGG